MKDIQFSPNELEILKVFCISELDKIQKRADELNALLNKIQASENEKEKKK